MFQKIQLQIVQLFASPNATLVLRALVFLFLVGASLMFPETVMAGPSPGGIGGSPTSAETFYFGF
jgi:hypothetical protein